MVHVQGMLPVVLLDHHQDLTRLLAWVQCGLYVGISCAVRSNQQNKAFLISSVGERQLCLV